MINAPQLLIDLKRRLTLLEADLRERINTLHDLKENLHSEWQAARDAERTAETFESWSEQVITQAGVHWLLSCVFLRFIEDNTLVDRPWIGGTPESGRLNLARDRHEAYFRLHPLESDREYLLVCFCEAGNLPGLHTFFDEAHNPVFRLGISGDAAMSLRQFWQQQDPNTGTLLHDFTDPDWNTRFLGDLYQDLSEATRKRYALLQTPEFVEEFILDRTLTPAIGEFGYKEVRMIDPTCGSGHFLLGGFHRMVGEWSRAEPARNRRDVAQKALDAVAGVDLNPFAIAISRFRLLVAALRVSDVYRLSEAPDFKIHVAIGDSLLHGKRFGLKATDDMFQQGEHFKGTGLAHAYASEDLAEVQFILGRQYHVVVGNPPYIIVKDSALNAAYRQQYTSCHGKYSLGAPFTERFFELAITGRVGQGSGFIGMITSNSFMKREFGSRLIEQVLPQLDLTHVVDTSGAYIPGHGTPTVILFGRHRTPVGSSVRTVMGIKGEPNTPENPAHGQVWAAIIEQIDHAGSESEFISVSDTKRLAFAKHPWSIGGGGAAELREQLDSIAAKKLGEVVSAVGVMVVTGEDDVFVRDSRTDFARAKIPPSILRNFAEGDAVRDWAIFPVRTAIYEYDRFGQHAPEPTLDRYFWIFRGLMRPAIYFGNTKEQRGMHWREYGVIVKDKLEQSLTIAVAEVATHNQFVLDRGGVIFKNSVPVIKLPTGASEAEHLGLLGLLNSSVACFWLQQVCHNKGGPGGGSSKDEKWHDFYAFNSTKVAEFPLVGERPVIWAHRIDDLAQKLEVNRPTAQFSKEGSGRYPATRGELDTLHRRSILLRQQMIATQEELDWHCYQLYGLTQTELAHLNPPEISLGERAFEIVMARRMRSGSFHTSWFEWLKIKPITELPSHWSADYRSVVEARIALIESDRSIALIESPNCKRRWESTSWEDQEKAAIKRWLLDRLEAVLRVGSADMANLTSCSKLADQMRADTDFMLVSELYVNNADFDLAKLVTELVVCESVPFLPVLRYTETGLRKRAQWEDTWALQRREDAGENVGDIPVPPKYKSTDFLKADFWRLRGGLDVPKERWISYPGCERGTDGSLVIAWAGWDHLQQATAIASFYLDMKDNEGWPPERLQSLLAGIQELVPWLKQWYNDLNPSFGERMGNYYEGFMAEEARAQGFTLEALRAWKPTTTAARRGRRATATAINL